MTKITLLAATDRGLRVLQTLREAAPDADLTVSSFREETFEPPFFEQIRKTAESLGAGFVEWDALKQATQLDCDLLLAVSWRFLVPDELRSSARRGAFVFHDSLLPRNRGFAPTVWSIVNGEPSTGVTLLKMAREADRGDIIDQVEVPMAADEYIDEILKRVTDAYLALLRSNLHALLTGSYRCVPQREHEATHTCKRLPEDNEIDWTLPTRTIWNLIRAASHPYPGAFSDLHGRRLTVWRATPPGGGARYAGRVPGRVVEFGDFGASVLTGDGILAIQTVEVDGGGEQPAQDVLNRLSFTLGRLR